MAQEPYVTMRKKLCKDPRVLAAATKLAKAFEGQTPPPGLFKAAILGGLFQLWCFGDDYGEFLAGVSQAIVDAECCAAGFCESLPPDWISQKKGGIRLPKYEAHNGPGAKERILGAKRVREHRDRQRNAESNGSGNGVETPISTPPPTSPATPFTPLEKPPPVTPEDASAIEGYCRSEIGLSFRDLGLVAREVLVDFGLAGVVDVLEHLASRRPTERFKGIRSRAAFVKDLLNKAEEGPLSREHDFQPFTRWRTNEQARVQHHLASLGSRPS